MQDENKKTVASYETGIDAYIQNTPTKRGDVIEGWIAKSLQGLQSAAKILEIGSADGRDAAIIEKKGFYVEKTDVARGFVEILQRQDPDARVLNILSDKIEDGYDLIIANAVFLHFNDSEFRLAASKVYKALGVEGVFSLTLKEGEGEAWQVNKGMSSRFFKFWSTKDISRLLADVGFTDIDIWTDASGDTNTSWIMVIARKS